MNLDLCIMLSQALTGFSSTLMLTTSQKNFKRISIRLSFNLRIPAHLTSRLAAPTLWIRRDKVLEHKKKYLSLDKLL